MPARFNAVAVAGGLDRLRVDEPRPAGGHLADEPCGGHRGWVTRRKIEWPVSLAPERATVCVPSSSNLPQEGFHTTLGAFRDGPTEQGSGARLTGHSIFRLVTTLGDLRMARRRGGPPAGRGSSTRKRSRPPATATALKRAGIGQKQIFDALIAPWRLDL